MIDRTLQEHVKACGELKTQIDNLTKEYNKHKEIITDELKERKTDNFTGSHYAVKYKEYERTSFDAKALKASNEDIYNRFTRTTLSSRFTVSTI